MQVDDVLDLLEVEEGRLDDGDDGLPDDLVDLEDPGVLASFGSCQPSPAVPEDEVRLRMRMRMRMGMRMRMRMKMRLFYLKHCLTG